MIKAVISITPDFLRITERNQQEASDHETAMALHHQQFQTVHQQNPYGLAVSCFLLHKLMQLLNYLV